MTTTQRRLLFVGHPDEAEISQWTSVRDLASQQGWETTRRFTPDLITCAIATDDVLGGVCTPTEASTLRAVTASSIPCMRAGDALVQLFARGDVADATA
ncbi:hypothetical protein ACWDUD_09820 [Rhodococcus sp. NPDC003382]|uniref:hypothetical protein n=1 Tax=unclassified Rhodococcus (in: high G+C Gram-positive bacteria) TaxID=192944 RepID=UPI0018CF34EE|nr:MULTISPECIES: hypothetical protein [unclassified Rhodococcus (in: high G+C Gram-positive bacteria)]MBH0122818.1 hypothetical protein [Rhodococcus sp. CX]MCK8672890.1 hypothetical protein [Rhodococcus sp. HM1]